MVMKFSTDRTEEVTIHRFVGRRARDKSQDQIRNPLLSLPAHDAVTRAHLRELRAAEMIAWEMTGGDYLILR